MRAIPRGDAAHRDYGGFAGDRALREIRRLLQQTDLAIAASLPIAERFREYGAAHVEHDRELRAGRRADRVRAAERRPRRRRLAGRQRAPPRHRDGCRCASSSGARSTRTRSSSSRRSAARSGCGTSATATSTASTSSTCRRSSRATTSASRRSPTSRSTAPARTSRSRNTPRSGDRGSPRRSGPYAALGEKQGGRLVPDDGWAEALGRLVEKPRERRKLAKRARKWGRAQAVSANAELWEQALSAAIVRAGGTPRPAGRPRQMSVARAPVCNAGQRQRRRLWEIESEMDRVEVQAMLNQEDRHWWYRGRRRIVCEELAQLPTGPTLRVLDAGCGSGRLLDELRDYGHVTGPRPQSRLGRDRPQPRPRGRRPGSGRAAAVAGRDVRPRDLARHGRAHRRRPRDAARAAARDEARAATS